MAGEGIGTGLWENARKNINKRGVILLDIKHTDTTFKAYSVLEISNMLGIGKTKTRELLDSGILPVTKVGRQYFTSPDAIQQYLKKNIGREIFF